MNNPELIPNRGNWQKLLTYKKANIIFRLTYFFCEKFMTRSDRTVDQMVQAARSGKQNIIEGSMASGTSAKTEIKLINVAKASLTELLEDYTDFLATRGYRLWPENSAENIAMRNLSRSNDDPEYFINLASTRSAETVANMTIVLLRQTDYLLYRQLQRLAHDFEQNGGFTERMYTIRKNNRGY